MARFCSLSYGLAALARPVNALARWSTRRTLFSTQPATLSDRTAPTAPGATGGVDLPLVVDWNGVRFGAASGYAMAFSLPELIAHAARTRALCAGTVIGTGTVSNANFREVGSSCIAERRGIETIDEGAPRTDYMRFGDRVRMEARTRDGEPLFGAIDQRVVPVTQV